MLMIFKRNDEFFIVIIVQLQRAQNICPCPVSNTKQRGSQNQYGALRKLFKCSLFQSKVPANSYIR